MMNKNRIDVGKWTYVHGNETIRFADNGYDVDLERDNVKEWINHIAGKRWSSVDDLHDLYDVLEKIQIAHPGLPIFSNPDKKYLRELSIESIFEKKVKDQNDE